MKAFVVALVVVAIVGESTIATRSSQLEWSLYKKQHGKSYESQAEDASRYANFLAAKQRAERHNAQPGQAYKMGLNHLSDWTDEERARLNGLRVDSTSLRHVISDEDEAYLAKILASSDEPVPDELDWRKVPDRVGPVGDQGISCRASWAFAAIGGIEGQELAQNKTKLVPLSAQQLVDCSGSNLGCITGSVKFAYSDIVTECYGGIMSDKDYPYTGEDDGCFFEEKQAQMTINGSIFLKPNDEGNLKEFVARFGPVPIVMDGIYLMSYSSGIIDEPRCGTTTEELNHAALLVGYGTDPKHGDYWIGKNSFGDKWGENGYFRLKRGVNMCGVALGPLIPKL